VPLATKFDLCVGNRIYAALNLARAIYRPIREIDGKAKPHRKCLAGSVMDIVPGHCRGMISVGPPPS
jgi:hypothetical protein